MERLTKRLDDFYGELNEIAFRNPDDPEGMYNLCDIVNWSDDEKLYEIANRLADYEDTGLEPEICAEYKKFEDELVESGVTFSRLLELVEADKKGRLVILPCKVGDTVYEPEVDETARVNGIGILINTHMGVYELEDLGKTVFLIRAEDEAALKERENDG